MCCEYSEDICSKFAVFFERFLSISAVSCAVDMVPLVCVGLMNGWCVLLMFRSLMAPLVRLGDVDVVGTDDVVAISDDRDEVRDEDDVDVDVDGVGEACCGA